MTKQLLIYSDVKPVSSQHHRDWSIKQMTNFEFAREVNYLPLMATEFSHAASEMVIVFTGEDNNLMPVVVLGIRSGENLFIDDQGHMTSRYVPAFLRRYPFVFSSEDHEQNFTLCLDESFSGCNKEGIGERLFNAEGEKTQYLDSVLTFLQEYQNHFNHTQSFCKKLLELDLLEPMRAQFTDPDGQAMTLSGFMIVNHERLKALPAEALEELVKTDAMALIYTHIHSMHNFSSLLDKVTARNKQGNKNMAEEAVL